MKLFKRKIMHEINTGVYHQYASNDVWKFMISNVSNPIWYGMGWWEDTGKFWLLLIGSVE